MMNNEIENTEVESQDQDEILTVEVPSEIRAGVRVSGGSCTSWSGCYSLSAASGAAL